MIDDSLSELFKAIENSNAYREYKKMVSILENNEDIMNLIKRIKRLEKEATFLESIQDNKYIEIDKEIKVLEEKLNNNYIYQEYLNKKEELNDELAISSKIIEKYISEKV